MVDGPVVRMRYLFGSLPFTTRMTVARLPSGRLWLHSPIEPTPGLLAEVRALGRVAALVAPNRLHWMHLADWQAACPDAETWGAPGLIGTAGQRGFRIDHELEDIPPPAWGGAIAQVLVASLFMTEAVFLHRPSSTLILTDLIENFERGRVRGGFLRFLMQLGGVVDPRGGTPRDLRLHLPRAAAGAARGGGDDAGLAAGAGGAGARPALPAQRHGGAAPGAGLDRGAGLRRAAHCVQRG